MTRWIKWGFICLGLGALLSVGTVTAALKLEESDAFCASCHTEPEQTYYDRSIASLVVDLASLHSAQQTRCIDCHSGEGFSGRLASLSQGAGDLWAYLRGDYARPAVTTHPLNDHSCTKCHADVLTVSVRNTHYHFFLQRWQAALPDAAGCVGCHMAHATESAQGFVDEAAQSVVCETCHRQRAAWRQE